MERYERQLLIRGFSQDKLKKAKVTVIGAGGLGSPILYYLAAAGVGNIKIVEKDEISLSNLNRQILYTTKDIGEKKAYIAQKRLKDLNPEINIEIIPEELTENNISKIIIPQNTDLVLDALDNLSTRYILNKYCVEKNIPFIHGGIEGFNGQVTFIIPHKTPCLACIFSSFKDENRTIPVVGVTPGVIGSIMATEAIKYLTGLGELLTEKLLYIDLLTMEFNKIQIAKDENCPICGNKTKNSIT